MPRVPPVCHLGCSQLLGVQAPPRSPPPAKLGLCLGELLEMLHWGGPSALVMSIQVSYPCQGAAPQRSLSLQALGLGRCLAST